MTEEARESMIGKWSDNAKSKREHAPEHYYGDLVRKIFFSAGVIMLLGLPFFAKYLELAVFVATFGVLVIGTVAGLTNPRQRLIVLFDMCVAAGACIIFEITAIQHYRDVQGLDAYVIFNQILALHFFCALYFCVKTYRAMLLNGARASDQIKSQ